MERSSLVKSLIYLFIAGFIIGVSESIGMSIAHPLYIPIYKTGLYIFIQSLSLGLALTLWGLLFIPSIRLIKATVYAREASALITFVIFVYGFHIFALRRWGENPMSDRSVYLLYLLVFAIIILGLGYLIVYLIRNIKKRLLSKVLLLVLCLFLHPLSITLNLS